MLSFLAGGRLPKRTNTASQKQVFYEDGRSSQIFHTAGESAHLVTHCSYPDTKLFNPPLHIHTRQRETFRVRQGVAHFFLDKRAWIPDATKPIVRRAGDVVVIPVGAYHRFRNGGDEGEELVIDIELDPDARTVEHRFFRNFFGYLDDCRKHNVEPSLFQMMHMLWYMNGPLAIPIPFVPNFVGVAVSQTVCFVLGIVIGRWLLGYEASYAEYYKEDID